MFTFLGFLFLVFFFFFSPEYSEAVPGLPTSYAAILRIKSGSSSLASSISKNRPRLSSPSLGSVPSSGWRGAAQPYHSPTNLYHFSEAFKHDGKPSLPLQKAHTYIWPTNFFKSSIFLSVYFSNSHSFEFNQIQQSRTENLSLQILQSSLKNIS